MIKKWFAMKKKEYEFKTMFYTYGIAFMKEKANLMKTLQNLYESCKEVPASELRDVFMEKLAQIIHERVSSENSECMTKLN